MERSATQKLQQTLNKHQANTSRTNLDATKNQSRS
jgi:hypothetical protein